MTHNGSYVRCNGLLLRQGTPRRDLLIAAGQRTDGEGVTDRTLKWHIFYALVAHRSPGLQLVEPLRCDMSARR
jgi:hypothetical protein